MKSTLGSVVPLAMFVNSVAMFTRHALLVLVLGLNVAINARFVHRLFAVRASNVRAGGPT